MFKKVLLKQAENSKACWCSLCLLPDLNGKNLTTENAKVLHEVHKEKILLIKIFFKKYSKKCF